MNLVYKMQPSRQQILGGGASDPTSELNVNAMCANGLLRIQDILRPRDAMMAAAAAAAAAGHQAADTLALHQHPGLHSHHLSQLHHGLTTFGGLKGSSISPPIGPDQSPPATPPMTLLHSPDSLKGSPDHHHHHHHHNNTKSSRDKDDLNSSKSNKHNSDKGMR